MTLLPVDERAAESWAQLRVELAERGRRMNVNDLWIAAIAVANDLPVVTQDNELEALSDVAGFRALLV